MQHCDLSVTHADHDHDGHDRHYDAVTVGRAVKCFALQGRQVMFRSAAARVGQQFYFSVISNDPSQSEDSAACRNSEMRDAKSA